MSAAVELNAAPRSFDRAEGIGESITAHPTVRRRAASVDQNEAKRRRTVDKRPLSGTHPIAAIEKRVIDSDAFAALSPSAVLILLLLARNLEKGRNGHVLLPQESAQKHGVANKTLYRQLKALATNGLIFQTKRGGYGKCSRYALTWLPLSKDTKGLHVDNFKPCAWRDWTPIWKKKPSEKMSTTEGQKYPFTPSRVGKNTILQGTKIPKLNLIPIGGDLSADTATPKAIDGARLMLCQYADCDTPVVGREYCAKHRHPTNAHTAVVCNAA